MKVRSDFVTNSSSSSFVIARKPQLTDAQKEAIISYVEQHLLGEVILTPDSTEEEIQKVFEDEWEFEDEDVQAQVREALTKGQSIFSDVIDFEEADYSYAAVFEELWEVLEKADEGNFTPIKDDLSY